MSETDDAVRQTRRKANVRLGLILASIAIAILVGFMVQVALFGA